MKPVCRNCSERYPGCHDRCMRFLKEKAKVDYARQKEFEDNELGGRRHLTYSKNLNRPGMKCNQDEYARQRKCYRHYIREDK